MSSKPTQTNCHAFVDLIASLTLSRALYWYAYSLEGLSLTEGYTVAPGCKGSAENGRCTLKEFLKYIFTPETDIPPGKTRPNNPYPPTDSDMSRFDKPTYQKIGGVDPKTLAQQIDSIVVYDREANGKTVIRTRKSLN